MSCDRFKLESESETVDVSMCLEREATKEEYQRHAFDI